MYTIHRHCIHQPQPPIVSYHQSSSRPACMRRTGGPTHRPPLSLVNPRSQIHHSFITTLDHVHIIKPSFAHSHHCIVHNHGVNHSVVAPPTPRHPRVHHSPLQRPQRPGTIDLPRGVARLQPRRTDPRELFEQDNVRIPSKLFTHHIHSNSNHSLTANQRHRRTRTFPSPIPLSHLFLTTLADH